MSNPPAFLSATRPIDPALADLLGKLQPGDRIQVTQSVRVGRKEWTTTTTGSFREVQYLETGLATDRVRSDDIVVLTVHYTKDNGELTSVAIDEKTRIQKM